MGMGQRAAMAAGARDVGENGGMAAEMAGARRSPEEEVLADAMASSGEESTDLEMLARCGAGAGACMLSCTHVAHRAPDASHTYMHGLL